MWKTKYAIYRDSTKVLLIRTDSMESVARHYILSADSLNRVAIEQTATINRLRRQYGVLSDSNRILTDSLDSLVIKLGPINPVTCRFCLLTNNSLRNQIHNDSLMITNLERRDTTRMNTIDSLNHAIELDTVVINQLQKQLRDLPEHPPTPRLFGILRMNPNQAFLAGGLFVITSYFILKK